MLPVRLTTWVEENSTVLTAAAALAGTLAGGACHLLDAPETGDLLWRVTLVASLIPLTWTVLRSLARGDLGVDVIALLAMAGALIGGELLAGSIVAVMLAGGNALEARADGRGLLFKIIILVIRVPADDAVLPTLVAFELGESRNGHTKADKKIE